MLTIQQLSQISWLAFPVLLWTMPWKGVALWKAARNNDKVWFIILLVANTLAILEIIYIFVFSKKKKKEDELIHTTLNI